MFQELKKCKTLKEIYTILGTKPFETAAFVLVLLWCLLPVWSAHEYFYWGIVGVNDMQKNYATMEGYKIAMQFVGSLSLVFACFYLLGRVVMNKGQILNKIKSEPWHFCLLAMLLWSCISTLLSDDIQTSFQGTSYRFDGLKSYFFYAAMYVCAFIVVGSKRKRVICDVFAIVASYVSLLVILQDFGNKFLNQCFVGGPRTAMFFQFNHTGYFLNLGIVCLMGLYVYETRLGLRIYYAVSLAFQLYAILVNSTFGSYLGSLCALIMVIVFYLRKNRKFSYKILVPVLIFFLISAASYMGYVPTSSGQDMRVNLMELFSDAKNIWDDPLEAKDAGHGRMTLWQQGLKMIPKRPIFGYGPEQMDEELSKIMWVDRPDNEFIQHAVFLGIPGLLFYLGALISLFIRQWKNMRKLEDMTLVAAGCVVAYLVSSLFGNSMFYTVPYLYMFLALASGRNIEECEK